MEGFNLNGRKENPKGVEFKKSIEKANEKIRFALKVLFISALSLLPNESSAQNSKNYNEKVEPEHQIEWQTDLVEKEKKKIENEIIEQKKWLEEYINSQKFTERLTKEYMLLKELGGEDQITDYNSFLSNKKFLEYVKNNEGDIIAIVNKLNPEELELIGDHELSLEKYSEIIEKNKELENLIPKQNTSKASKAVLNMVNKIKEQRLNVLNYGPIIVVDSIPNPDTNSLGKIYGINYDGGLSPAFEIENPKILVIKDFIGDGKTTPIHELTHRSTKGDDKINLATYFLLKNRANSKSEYLNTPTEIHARINELRYWMDKEGLYNAKKEDFNNYHYNYMLNNEEIMKNFTIKQLLQTLDKEDLIWFMNNLADTNIVMLDTHEYA